MCAWELRFCASAQWECGTEFFLFSKPDSLCTPPWRRCLYEKGIYNARIAQLSWVPAQIQKPTILRRETVAKPIEKLNDTSPLRS